MPHDHDETTSYDERAWLQVAMGRLTPADVKVSPISDEPDNAIVHLGGMGTALRLSGNRAELWRVAIEIERQLAHLHTATANDHTTGRKDAR